MSESSPESSPEPRFEPSPGHVPAQAALEASRVRVAQRKGVPMVVSLRTAGAATPPADPSAGDLRLARLFEACHAQLHPDGADDESALIASLAAAGYLSLTGDATGEPFEEEAGGTTDRSPAAACPQPGPAEINYRSTLSDLRAGRFLRVMNYHNTPPSMRGELVDELRGLARDFATVTVDDLDRFARTGVWHQEKPPVLPVFYEGYRDNYEVAAAACEEAGVVGWFFICTAFLDAPVTEQYDYASAHRIKLVDENPRAERIAMTWQEVADLHRRGHVVTPHTASHELAERVVTAADLRREVIEPKQRMDEATGGDAACTAWLAGTHWTGRTDPDRALVDAGYRYVFSNTMIQRLPDAAA
ncbi:Polysaccharide deacetylase [Streptomyces sp. YIM 130001]|uniref:polysaccharide deacetylase family protein n=1 Tax=Streptomyces sp. YIM 130001 TaxID=2259644 RepID=UPI000E64A907|nr:polysaccharide deacetylase family protein [Streptomyces sp. YIM 130001]RII15634.1 Polysaccharide deacetylase [Streptomyces sp. YIM 130001]